MLSPFVVEHKVRPLYEWHLIFSRDHQREKPSYNLISKTSTGNRLFYVGLWTVHVNINRFNAVQSLYRILPCFSNGYVRTPIENADTTHMRILSRVARDYRRNGLFYLPLLFTSPYILLLGKEKKVKGKEVIESRYLNRYISFGLKQIETGCHENNFRLVTGDWFI